ncbi:succinate dehydrogenase, hydrophobic membrane anchor protein [Rhodobacterales bacterium HKCCE2091]|nr:succinate dehydrogenase, hydrophobic membrane anchor protein [Rhodobacterales bacterium HKCCE2091]
MQFLTDRKKVTGLGTARTGTEHHWTLTTTSVGLLILTPFFLYYVGSAFGQSYEDAIAILGRPFPAIVTGLMLAIGFHHFRIGIQAVIDDYVDGKARKIALVLMSLVAYGLAAAGLFAIASIAL